MNFLIQTKDEQPIHDFSRELIEGCRYNKWLDKSFKYSIDFVDWDVNDKSFDFIDSDIDLIPIGSVEFVSAYLERFYGVTPKPRNIPDVLNKPDLTYRTIFNGTKHDLKIGEEKFVKSNEKIKSFTGVITKDVTDFSHIPDGELQISDIINIDSEYRCFVYKGELVGLKHYSGDFTVFPSIAQIYVMINEFKDAPVAYTLDIGINNHSGRYLKPKETFIIEVHDFFSCGLYGFNDYRLLPHMFTKWFREYISLIKND